VSLLRPEIVRAPQPPPDRARDTLHDTRGRRGADGRAEAAASISLPASRSRGRSCRSWSPRSPPRPPTSSASSAPPSPLEMG